MKTLKERAQEQYKGWKKPAAAFDNIIPVWKKPTVCAQTAFDRIMDKAKIDQGLDSLTIYESPKKQQFNAKIRTN